MESPKSSKQYDKYKFLFIRFLNKSISTKEFENSFMKMWRSDRDNVIIHDDRFQRILDRIFTSLDVYDDPDVDKGFDNRQLYKEVKLLSYIWFGI